MKYILIKSRRKTLSLTIGPDAILKVRSPIGLELSSIEKIIYQKRDWIERQISKYKNLENQPFVRSYKDGEILFYLGDKYILKTDLSVLDLVVSEGVINVPQVSLRLRKALIVKWYSNKTHELASRFVEECVSQGLKCPKNVSITHAGKQWGSCSSSGKINFSWRLCMLPDWIIRYIVVHELSHLKYHNHSKKFWALVSLYSPEYRKAKNWIKNNYSFLVF